VGQPPRKKGPSPEHATGERVRAPKTKPRALGALPQAGPRGETRRNPDYPRPLFPLCPRSGTAGLLERPPPSHPPGGRGGSSGSRFRCSAKATASCSGEVLGLTLAEGGSSLRSKGQFVQLSGEALNMFRAPWNPLKTRRLTSQLRCPQ
jgi:hypothetical protein